jgi:hypothetical protein
MESDATEEQVWRQTGPEEQDHQQRRSIRDCGDVLNPEYPTKRNKGLFETLNLVIDELFAQPRFSRRWLVMWLERKGGWSGVAVDRVPFLIRQE